MSDFLGDIGTGIGDLLNGVLGIIFFVFYLPVVILVISIMALLTILLQDSSKDAGAGEAKSGWLLTPDKIFMNKVPITNIEIFINGSLAEKTKLSGFVNDCTNFFDGNAIWLWNVHLKKNQKEIGKYQAEKEFKSANSEYKLHMPERLRQKASAIMIYNSIQDSQNLDSPTHPINAYGLEDIKSKSVYSTSIILNKSRTGNEGRTQARLLYIDGSFDIDMHAIATALDLGILEKGSGNYPNGQTPHIFKEDPDAKYENEIMGRRMKQSLMLKGYSRPTNIIEARLLMKYTGDNPEVCKARDEFIVALYQRLEDVLWYELEINSISEKEMETSKKKTQHLFSLIRNVTKKTILTADEIEEKKDDIPTTVFTVDSSVMDDTLVS